MLIVDALYNFVANELDGFGVFGGLSLGYAEQKYPSTGYTRDGLDFGINLGFKGNFLPNQSAEFFTRFGLLGPQVKRNNLESSFIQNYQIGVRYIFSF